MRLPAGAGEALVNDPTFLRQLVEAALNRFLDAEIAEHLQAGPYERSEARSGYRNGYRARQLRTRVGTLTLAVPMDREGTFKSELFDRYQRSEKALVGTLMEVYLEGVSTRKVKDRDLRPCAAPASARAPSAASSVAWTLTWLRGAIAAWRSPTRTSSSTLGTSMFA
jgi:transposase-like protein